MSKSELNFIVMYCFLPSVITVHKAQTLLSHVKKVPMVLLNSLALRQNAKDVNQGNTVRRMDSTKHLATAQQASFVDTMLPSMNPLTVSLVSIMRYFTILFR